METTPVATSPQAGAGPNGSAEGAGAAVQPALYCEGVTKIYRGPRPVHALRGVSLSVMPGEFVALMGPSGSGKSTLLHILGALDSPDAGTIEFSGHDLARMTGTERSRLRNTQFGFVFQFYHLLPELNVVENTMLGQMVRFSTFGFAGQRAALRERAVELLTQLGMDHRLTHRPSQLSGGERQRVAIARALMNNPRVLFADEPTGNLDAETGAGIVRLLRDLNRDEGLTIIMVTHNLDLVGETDRVVRLVSGRIEEAFPPVLPGAG